MNLFNLEHKTILLTGGCGVLGGGIAKYLLENGADANAIEHNNTTTAMSIAQMLGNQNAIKLLEQYKQ